MLLAILVAAALVAAGCSGAEQMSAQRSDVSSSDASPEWITLFDGKDFEGWTMSGPGGFVLEPDGSMLGQGGMGLFYYSKRPFRDFVLELEWKAVSDSANSGIFLRFPEAPDPWVPVNTGYEVQIDDKRDPDHRTGAIYSFSSSFKLASKPPGEWNTYRIEVAGQRYQIWLNGEKVNDFFGDRTREGYIGLQNHDDASKVWFRNVRVRPLPPGTPAPESLADLFAVDGDPQPIRVLMLTATQGFRHGPAIQAAKEVMTALSATTGLRVDTTEDLTQLNPENLAKYDVLFFSNSTLRGGDDRPEAAAPAEPALKGSWRTYDLRLSTPDAVRGRVALDGTPGSLRGNIWFEGFEAPTPVVDAHMDGSTLNFHFDGGQYGQITVVAALEGAILDGRLTAGGNPMPLNGRLVDETTADTGAADREQAAATTTQEQRDAILGFLHDGKGVVLAHSALDAFYGWDAYREMAGGGLFESHPWTQSVRIQIEDPDNPAVQHFGDAFWIRDEIYVLDQNPRWNARVLASLDMQSVGVTEGPADAQRNDYPISWIRNHNGGRVFVTKLGHFADVWKTPDYLQHLLQGIRMAAGRLPADFSGHRVREVIASGLWPDDIAVDERGNVWIAELRGKVHRYDAATGETRQIALVPTTDPTKIEHGLFGIEVDPAFYEGQPYVYLYYTEPETFINTLARYEYRDGRIDLATRRVILRVPTEPQCCHQAGDLEWGPDGTLYVSTGDTGMSETQPDWEISEARIEAFKQRHNLRAYHWSRLVDSERSAQNLQDLRGKILRIHKDGTIPKDNPFYGQPGVRWEIYAYGLRNPYRFKVDQQTGVLYIGVVGPDASFDYDEYNLSSTGGENFGWPRTLGKLFYNEWRPEMVPDYVPPAWEYTYETGGRSATVGPIYRHTGPGAFPDVFQDKVFLFDWARRWIKWADVQDATFENDAKEDVKTPPMQVRLPAKRFVNIKQFDQLTDTAPISMELGPDGSLYVAEFDGFWDAGPNARVTRYRWVSGNGEPLGDASFAPVPGSDGRTIRFDGARSYDPDADRLTFRWDFGDGAGSTERSPAHTYAAAGTYIATLIVTDEHGLAGRPVTLTVPAGAPAPSGSAPAPLSSDAPGGRR